MTISEDSQASSKRRTPAFCAQCRSRCGCVAVLCAEKLVGVEPLYGHPSGARLCPKGKTAPDLVYHPDRLMQPLRRTAPKNAPNPGWEPIAWNEALGEIATRMASIREQHGAEQVAFSVTSPSGSQISDSILWIGTIFPPRCLRAGSDDFSSVPLQPWIKQMEISHKDKILKAVQYFFILKSFSHILFKYT